MTVKKKIVISVIIACVFFLILLCNLAYHSNHDLLCYVRPKTRLGDSQRKVLQDIDMDDDSMDLFHPKGMKRRLPQAIIIGVRKCGTRALLAMLKLHPKIQAASDEIHFFDREENYSRGLDWYRRRMPYSFPDQITMEKSPAYFITDEVPSRIYEMDPSVKLVLIVREPTTRVISDYTQIHSHKTDKNKPHSKFEELAIQDGEVSIKFKAVRTSNYAKHFDKWLDVFPKDQIHVVDGDKLILNPVPELQKVEDFLGLDHKITYDNFYFNETRGFYCMKDDLMSKCLSESKGRPHPYIEPWILQKLHEFYRPHNARFEELVGMKFDWPQ
ncbi:heparan sulfate glucosamine 3-O-sulfotransferase 1-like [Saccoglossus kowalevskii]|uniref:Heparan sulfate glucosamine 3-O-sulfotransferase 5-like n=1 Tax=Saccoglossus kowalevskii TaxID=10224 RepID=A0ABM0GXU3_SACKO|nr:PREDICTED: heparan sulfate glucosamine 3-O-sulfotransferase 5-like [Saccoglossus kowalevskii]